LINSQKFNWGKWNKK